MDISKAISLLMLLLTFAILIQFLVNRLKVVLGSTVSKYLPADVLAALLGIVFAFMFNIDIFQYLGLTSSIPVIGFIVSGLVISAGAPAIHELITSIREQRKQLEDYSDKGEV